MRILALLMLLSLIGCGQQAAVAPKAAGRLSDPIVSDVGAKVKLSRAEGSGKILLAIDKESYTALADWKSKGTETILRRLQDEKRVFEVESDTEAVIEEAEPGHRRVKILSGPHQNERGWIAAEDVVESRQ